MYERIEEIVDQLGGSTALPSDILAQIIDESRLIDTKLTAKARISSAEEINSLETHFRLVAFEKYNIASTPESSREIGHLILCQVWRNAIEKSMQSRREELMNAALPSLVTPEERQELDRKILADQALLKRIDAAREKGSFQWRWGLTWVIAQKYPLEPVQGKDERASIVSMH